MRTLLALFLSSFVILSSSFSAPPNILLILADDLGYNDLSCQGATKLKTPNIDRIAKEGTRFTDAHAPAAVCCPSRYGLMTGRYAWRRPLVTWASAGAPLLIEDGRLTVASLLKKAGYATGIVGKWHLGYGTREKPVTWSDELKPGPLECGFDYFFGHDNNRDLNVENHRVVGLEDGKRIPTKKELREGAKAVKLADGRKNAITLHEKALAYLDRQNGKQPFFLYYAPNNIHVPLSPTPRFRGSSECGVYGDFAQELDWSVGELLDLLDKKGLTQDTLVIFSADNGARYELATVKAGHRANAPLNGQKGDVWEGGHRVPFLVRWPGHVPAGRVCDQLVCLTDLMATFAALTGQNVPPGAGEDSVNALPAFLDQEDAKGLRQHLIVQSLSASLTAKKNRGPDELWAVREGPWVLVRGQGAGHTTNKTFGDKERYFRLHELGLTNSDFTADTELKPNSPPQQLYNLDTDLGQTRNVFQEHPDIVARLNALFEKLAASQPSP
ncbi:MAG: arylsulfatase [Prosthecobacter sp.]|jgi:arylsulfatase A|uniref:sulfatase family protein n=1 Tax=Prosthecobacter sp. TaxID=1965333 RepID=UPI0019D8BEFE|nr:arylsulfatase [Prosthecobacter sp.]MBE2284791.1 arylsulfatase [Prosthecobacter sp.]